MTEAAPGGAVNASPGPDPNRSGADMERTEQPGPRNRATKWTARLGLAGVSAIAAVVSYFHALAVVQHAGARPPVAYLVPFLADLVILGASAALLDASRESQPRPPLAGVALVAGIGVTLAMNVAAGWGNGLAGALVAGWPAVAFILALESLAGILRRGRAGSFPEVHGAGPATSAHADPPGPLSPAEALAALVAADSQRKLAELLGVPKSRVQAWAAMVREVDGAAREDVPAGGPSGPRLPPGRGPGGQAQPGAATGDTPAGKVPSPAPAPAGAQTPPAGVMVQPIVLTAPAGGPPAAAANGRAGHG